MYFCVDGVSELLFHSKGMQIAGIVDLNIETAFQEYCLCLFCHLEDVRAHEEFVQEEERAEEHLVTEKQYIAQRMAEEDISEARCRAEFEALWEACEEQNVLHDGVRQVFLGECA